MKVSEIMTEEVITVNEDTPLTEAASLLAKMRIHGMPVVNNDNKVVGIITESDFFAKDSSNIYLPTFMEFVKNSDKSELKDDISSKWKKISKVKDIMSGECVTVKPDMTLDELIFLFKDRVFNSVPVVNDNGVLVGIVTIIDIIRLL